jgi:hypothetical protein
VKIKSPHFFAVALTCLLRASTGLLARAGITLKAEDSTVIYRQTNAWGTCVNLSPVALPGKKLEALDFTALSGGSGMIGLPRDFTLPSRFVLSLAFSGTACLGSRRASIASGPVDSCSMLEYKP